MRKLAGLCVPIALVACDRSVPTPSAASSEAPRASSVTATATGVTAAPPGSAVSGATSGAAAGRSAPTVVRFDDDAVGGPPASFEGVVGDWSVVEKAGARGLYVDGSKWRSGEPSASLADQAKRLYGDRYAEFLDGVKAFAFFPFAIYRTDPPPSDTRISVRFYPEAGKIDQGAGILWGIAGDGSYWGARANALEDNILYFHVVKGRRTVIDNVRNVPTPSKTWHTLAVELRDKSVIVELDGQKKFEKKTDARPPGRIGLWSKADSQVLFDDFTVTPLGP